MSKGTVVVNDSVSDTSNADAKNSVEKSRKSGASTGDKAGKKKKSKGADGKKSSNKRRSSIASAAGDLEIGKKKDLGSFFDKKNRGGSARNDGCATVAGDMVERKPLHEKESPTQAEGSEKLQVKSPESKKKRGSSKRSTSIGSAAGDLEMGKKKDLGSFFDNKKSRTRSDGGCASVAGDMVTRKPLGESISPRKTNRKLQSKRSRTLDLEMGTTKKDLGSFFDNKKSRGSVRIDGCASVAGDMVERKPLHEKERTNLTDSNGKLKTRRSSTLDLDDMGSKNELGSFFQKKSRRGSVRNGGSASVAGDMVARTPLQENLCTSSKADAYEMFRGRRSVTSPRRICKSLKRPETREVNQAEGKWKKISKKLDVYNWWKRLESPSRNDMLAKCKTQGIDLTVEDVAMLPWLADGLTVDLPKIMDWLDEIETLAPPKTEKKEDQKVEKKKDKGEETEAKKKGKRASVKKKSKKVEDKDKEKPKEKRKSKRKSTGGEKGKEKGSEEKKIEEKKKTKRSSGKKTKKDNDESNENEKDEKSRVKRNVKDKEEGKKKSKDKKTKSGKRRSSRRTNTSSSVDDEDSIVSPRKTGTKGKRTSKKGGKSPVAKSPEQNQAKLEMCWNTSFNTLQNLFANQEPSTEDGCDESKIADFGDYNVSSSPAKRKDNKDKSKKSDANSPTSPPLKETSQVIRKAKSARQLQIELEIDSLPEAGHMDAFSFNHSLLEPRPGEEEEEEEEGEEYEGQKDEKNKVSGPTCEAFIVPSSPPLKDSSKEIGSPIARSAKVNASTLNGNSPSPTRSESKKQKYKTIMSSPSKNEKEKIEGNQTSMVLPSFEQTLLDEQKKKEDRERRRSLTDDTDMSDISSCSENDSDDDESSDCSNLEDYEDTELEDSDSDSSGVAISGGDSDDDSVYEDHDDFWLL